MHFKDLKLGVKMTIGFGAVIVLVSIVGIIAIVSMLNIQQQAKILELQQVPLIDNANNVERNSLETMYNMRGYSMVMENEYYLTAGKYLADVVSSLDATSQLTEKYNSLAGIRSSVTTADKDVKEYSSLAEDTRHNIDTILGNRELLDKNAALFMENCYAFQVDQIKKFTTEIEARLTPGLLKERMKKVDLINNIIDMGNTLRVNNFKGQLFMNTEMMKTALNTFRDYKNVIGEIRRITREELNMKELAAVEAAGDAYAKSMEDIIAAYDSLISLQTKRNAVAERVLTSARNLSTLGMDNIKKVAKNSADTIQVAVGTVIIGLLIALVLAIVVALLLTMLIVNAMNKGVRFAEEIAAGDFAAMLDIKQKDEVGKLADSLRNMQQALKDKAQVIGKIADGDLTVNITLASDRDELGKSLVNMRNALNELLSQVNIAVDMVANGSDQISQSSQSLSQGAAEQASSLEEISSSMNEIAGQSRQNAENATQANTLARTAMTNVESGNTQMEQLVTSMQNINNSSIAITKIVKIIDDIAFQINLLALNANVEAARAGKYGKGFAVVADEVRSLAVKSANSVKETTAMVQEALANIEIGNKAADITAKQLKEILDGAAKVAALVGEIAAASKEQAQGIDQINTGLEQVNQVTQSNTANAEESASAAEELASQAQQLKAMISRFTIDTTGKTAGNNTGNNISNDYLYKLVEEEVRRIRKQENAGIKSV